MQAHTSRPWKIAPVKVAYCATSIAQFFQIMLFFWKLGYFLSYGMRSIKLWGLRVEGISLTLSILGQLIYELKAYLPH